MLIRDMIKRLPDAKKWYIDHGNRPCDLPDDINEIDRLIPSENIHAVKSSCYFSFRVVRLDFNCYEWELLR
jgi:hypothetical protein